MSVILLINIFTSSVFILALLLFVLQIPDNAVLFILDQYNFEGIKQCIANSFRVYNTISFYQRLQCVSSIGYVSCVHLKKLIYISDKRGTF